MSVGILIILLLATVRSGYSETEVRVLFDLDGGIYSIRPDGSDLTQISDPVSANGGWDSAPTGSPDGLKIAFTYQPNGGDYHEIWTMAADGSGRAQLTFPDSFLGDAAPVWSPVGGSIAFASYVDPDRASVAANDREIYVVDREGAHRTRLTNRQVCGPGCAPSYSPTWSPDGQRLAYTNKGIWVMDVDGSNQMLLVSDGRDPAWSPEGTRIAFLRTDTRPSVPSDYLDIWTTDLEGANQVNLTSSLDIPGGKTIIGPAWSPDGSQLAFNTWHEFNQPPTLWVMDADGTGLVLLGAGQNPSWLVGEHPTATWAEIKKLAE